jgi:hypothetical protein
VYAAIAQELAPQLFEHLQPQSRHCTTLLPGGSSDFHAPADRSRIGHSSRYRIRIHLPRPIFVKQL